MNAIVLSALGYYGFKIVGFPETVSNILKRQQLATKQGEGFIYFLTFGWYI